VTNMTIMVGLLLSALRITQEIWSGTHADRICWWLSPEDQKMFRV
jgi:hypothetical protein